MPLFCNKRSRKNDKTFDIFKNLLLKTMIDNSVKTKKKIHFIKLINYL